MRIPLFVKNTTWLMVLQAVNILLPFITIPYVTRILGVDQYGVFSLALNWITYFQVLIEYGFNLSATRKVAIAKTHQEIERIFADVICVRLLFLVLCLFIAIALCIIFSVSTAQAICTFCLFSMLLGIALQLNWLFQGLQDMKIITISTALARILSVILIFALVQNQNSLFIYAFLYSITYVFSALFTHLVAHRKYSLKPSRPTLRGMKYSLLDGWSIFISSASGKIIGSFGITVLGVVASTGVVGAYSAVQKLPQLIATMFTPISQALFPKASIDAAASPKNLRRTVTRIGIPTCIFFITTLVLINLFSEQLITLLFGSQYLSCKNVVLPLSIWVALGIINNFLGIQMLIPLGFQALYGKLMTVAAFLTLAMCIVLGTLYKAVGIAIAMAFNELFLTAALMFYLVKKIAWDY